MTLLQWGSMFFSEAKEVVLEVIIEVIASQNLHWGTNFLLIKEFSEPVKISAALISTLLLVAKVANTK